MAGLSEGLAAFLGGQGAERTRVAEAKTQHDVEDERLARALQQQESEFGRTLTERQSEFGQTFNEGRLNSDRDYYLRAQAGDDAHELSQLSQGLIPAQIKALQSTTAYTDAETRGKLMDNTFNEMTSGIRKQILQAQQTGLGIQNANQRGRTVQHDDQAMREGYALSGANAQALENLRSSNQMAILRYEATLQTSAAWDPKTLMARMLTATTGLQKTSAELFAAPKPGQQPMLSPAERTVVLTASQKIMSAKDPLQAAYDAISTGAGETRDPAIPSATAKASTYYLEIANLAYMQRLLPNHGRPGGAGGSGPTPVLPGAPPAEAPPAAGPVAPIPSGGASRVRAAGAAATSSIDVPDEFKTPLALVRNRLARSPGAQPGAVIAMIAQQFKIDPRLLRYYAGNGPMPTPYAGPALAAAPGQ